MLLAAALAGTTLTACSSGDDGDQYNQVCTDSSGNRVDDSKCGNSNGGGSGSGMNAFEWYFILSGLNQPRMGSQVVHNHYYTDHGLTHTRPTFASSINAGVPKDGAPGVKGAATTPNKPPKGYSGTAPKVSTNKAPSKSSSFGSSKSGGSSFHSSGGHR